MRACGRALRRGASGAAGDPRLRLERADDAAAGTVGLRHRRRRPRPSGDPLRRQLPRLVAELGRAAVGRLRPAHARPRQRRDRAAGGRHADGHAARRPGSGGRACLPRLYVRAGARGDPAFPARRGRASRHHDGARRQSAPRPGRGTAGLRAAAGRRPAHGALLHLPLAHGGRAAGGADRGRRGGAGPSYGPAGDGGLGQALRGRRHRGSHGCAQGAVRRQARLLRRAGLAA